MTFICLIHLFRERGNLISQGHLLTLTLLELVHAHMTTWVHVQLLKRKLRGTLDKVKGRRSIEFILETSLVLTEV